MTTSRKQLIVSLYNVPSSIGASRIGWVIGRARPSSGWKLLFAAVGAVFVNLAVIALLVQETRLVPSRPMATEAGDPRGQVMEVFFIDGRLDRKPPTVSIDRRRSQRQLLQRGSIEFATQPLRFASSQSLEEDEGTTQRLRGIYRKQLRARIDRAWQRPSGSISLYVQPHCVLRVEQGTGGAIRSISESSCSADAAWRSSLMSAIRAAAPLPAPPRSDLLSQTLELEVGQDISVRLLRSTDRSDAKNLNAMETSPE